MKFYPKKLPTATAISIKLVAVKDKNYIERQKTPEHLRKLDNGKNYYSKHKSYIRQELFACYGGTREQLASQLFSQYGNGIFYLQTVQWTNVVYANPLPNRKTIFGTITRHGRNITGWIRREKRMRKTALIDLRGSYDSDGIAHAKIRILRAYTLSRYRWAI